MIKIGVSIPEVFDTADPLQLQEFCTAVKLYCEELARKAKSVQDETRSTVPTANDLEEKEDVDYVSGASYIRYTKVSGNIKYMTLS